MIHLRPNTTLSFNLKTNGTNQPGQAHRFRKSLEIASEVEKLAKDVATLDGSRRENAPLDLDRREGFTLLRKTAVERTDGETASSENAINTIRQCLTGDTEVDSSGKVQKLQAHGQSEVRNGYGYQQTVSLERRDDGSTVYQIAEHDLADGHPHPMSDRWTTDTVTFNPEDETLTYQFAHEGYQDSWDRVQPSLHVREIALHRDEQRAEKLQQEDREANRGFLSRGFHAVKDSFSHDF